MIGIDIVEISRIAALDLPLFINRVFTVDEAEYINSKKFPNQTIAGMFALKEAVVKALGCGIGDASFKEIEILHTQSGQPVVTLNGECLRILNQLKYTTVHASISHTDTTAVAVAILSNS